jgi:hypothetical protein
MIYFYCADKIFLCFLIELKRLIENSKQCVAVVNRIKRQDREQTDDQSYQ